MSCSPKATTALVEGETLQAAAVKDNQFTREVYARIIALKTAALFKAAATLGARAANASRAVEQALADYGFNIGLAFQIVDDVLDITAPSEQLGKTSGIDIEQGRGFAVAFESADDMPTNGDPIAALRERVLKGMLVREGYDQARRFVEIAVAGLSVLPSSRPNGRWWNWRIRWSSGQPNSASSHGSNQKRRPLRAPF